MLDGAVLNQLIFDAFTGKMSWYQASQQHPVDDFIEAFYRTRATMRKQLDGLTDAQANFYSEQMGVWSLSETVTHLIFSQNAYYNGLLDITSLQRPHLSEAARGFGEGSHQGIAAAELRTRLDAATALMTDVINETRGNYDPSRIGRNPLFGDVSYATGILLLLGHEIDHVRQAIAMRRAARAAFPGTQTMAAVTLPAVTDAPNAVSPAVSTTPAAISPVVAVPAAPANVSETAAEPPPPVPAVHTPSE